MDFQNSEFSRSLNCVYECFNIFLICRSVKLFKFRDIPKQTEVHHVENIGDIRKI